MDDATLRALRDLPDDLRALGWESVPEESHYHGDGESRWYTAVFARPYRHGSDDVQ
jgi:hypothetical protein